MQDKINNILIIDSIKKKSKLIDLIALLVIFSVFLINIKVTFTVLDYTPSTSVAFLLLIVSLLVFVGFHLSRKIAHSTIDSLVKYSDQIGYNAYHDSLTYLPNRSFFEKNLEISYAREKRNKDYVFAVFFIQIDRFKMINESLGDMMGDQLLIEISQTLQSCLRSNDFIARLGGDEFAVLLDDIQHTSNLTIVVDRIFKKLRLPMTLNKQDVFTSVSIGIAISDARCDHPHYMMRDAEIAMYRAKSLGGSRHVVFDVAMQHNAVALSKLDTDL